ncbi:thrombospondin type 3 repeat-containing protein [Candidatus Spongiihabitans sp.]|uniref:thrombospondin type 3 repeat-containing protein n=1 Tax=Candidatus Spongiihabitans sp. TaxID=3101308 RepID=UPI003C7CDB22
MKLMIINHSTGVAATQFATNPCAIFLISVHIGFSCLAAPAFAAENLDRDAKKFCLDLTKQAPISGRQMRNSGGQTQQDINDIQIKSLLNVYHGGKKSFAEKRRLVCMTAVQHQRARERLHSLNRADTLFFKTHLKPRMLRLLALRDSDGDGILDFRIKEAGTFLANDTDADNDGIRNLFDPRPQTARPIKDQTDHNDEDQDGLPDHLDWSNTNRFNLAMQKKQWQKKQYLVDAQLSAFQKYGIVYIQSDYVFTPQLADLAIDVLNIFDRQYQKYNLEMNAQSLTTARQYDVAPNDGIVAEVSSVNGQIIVYAEGISNLSNSTDNLISTLLTVIHEFAHVVQNAMDYPQNQTALLKQNIHQQPNVFAAYVNRLGWQLNTRNRKDNLPNHGYVNHGQEPVAAVEIYKNREPTSIAKICAGEKHPALGQTTRKIWEEVNGIQCYAFVSVREWHAEYVAVTVLSEMYARLKQTHGNAAEKIIRRAQAKIKLDFDGEGYDYNNADKKAVNTIAEDLEMPDILLDRLNEKYLVEPFLNSPAH